MAQRKHIFTRHFIPQVTEVSSLHQEVDSASEAKGLTDTAMCKMAQAGDTVYVALSSKQRLRELRLFTQTPTDPQDALH